VIKYNDDIIIGIQLGEKGYCHYINKKENIQEDVKNVENLNNYDVLDWGNDDCNRYIYFRINNIFGIL